jgi:hypothetical protein
MTGTFTEGDSLSSFINFDEQTSQLLAGESSRLDTNMKQELNEQWSAAGPDGGFQDSFGISFPGDPRTHTKPMLNTTELSTLHIRRFQRGYERSLLPKTMLFILLKSTGQDNNATAALACSLPVVNHFMQMGQLTETVHTDWFAENPVGTTTYKKTQIRNAWDHFADGQLYDAPEGDKFDTEATAQPGRLDRMVSLHGVVQRTTGIAQQLEGSNTGQLHCSLAVRGLTQTQHLWGAYTPGTRLYYAVVRMPREFSMGAHLLSEDEAPMAPAQFGLGSCFAKQGQIELEPMPYVYVPCWGGVAPGVKFNFHPRHAAGIAAANAMHPHDPIHYINVGILTHAPQFRQSVENQERAVFDQRFLVNLPLSTINFDAKPL